MVQKKPKKFIWKKHKTMRDFRSHTEKHIEKFWVQNIKPEMSVADVDNKIHTLIHSLLLKGEENPANVHSVHLHKSML